MISIIAEAIASHIVTLVELRRASHAPASVDSDTRSTATQAPAPGEAPSNAGPSICVPVAGSMFHHLLSGFIAEEF
ncbi:hypothetical protein ACFQX6_09775 [Streptosporangium lutulentum]